MSRRMKTAAMRRLSPACLFITFERMASSRMGLSYAKFVTYREHRFGLGGLRTRKRRRAMKSWKMLLVLASLSNLAFAQVLPKGTEVMLRFDSGVSSKSAKVGDQI